MRIAAFNVENLFDRAKAFNLESEEQAKAILAAEGEFNSLIAQRKYSDTDKAHMLELLGILELLESDNAKFARLRRNRGHFISRGAQGPRIVAAGREDWIGWVELVKEHVNAVAIENTGRVIRDVDADILAVVEADNRIALRNFSEFILKQVEGQPYQQVMVIDGNDQRGIDVGLMTKRSFTIDLMRSHVHDLDSRNRPLFSRDCPEFAVRAPSGETLWVLPNHLKSKFGGDDAASQKKRAAQAKRTAEIYRALREEGQELVVVLGDFNDTPDSAPLSPLLRETDLRDVSEHPVFDTGEFAGKGTFGLGNDDDKIDYLLLSPALFDRVTGCGLYRKGAWPGSRPKRWTVYPELTKEHHVASDHHVIWADIRD